MTTQAEVTAAVHELSHEASPTAVIEHVLGSSQARSARPSRLRRVLPIAAVVLVAAVAIEVAVIASHARDQRQNTDTGSASTTSTCLTSTKPSFATFSVGHVADLDDTITDATTCSGYRTRSYYTTSGGQLGAITLYQPGVFNQNVALTGKHVSGSGITGYYVDKIPNPAFTACNAPGEPITCEPGIAWQYTSGSWATVSSLFLHSASGVGRQFFGTDPIKKLLAVAAAVRANHSDPLLTPFKLRKLAGTVPIKASTSTTSVHHNDVGQAEASLQLSVPGAGRDCPSQAACAAAVSISVNSTVDPPGSSLGDFKGRHVQIGSSTGLLVPGSDALPPEQLRFRVGQWMAIIAVADPKSGITDQQLLTLARGMTFARSTTNTTTWYHFDEATPR